HADRSRGLPLDAAPVRHPRRAGAPPGCAEERQSCAPSAQVGPPLEPPPRAARLLAGPLPTGAGTGTAVAGGWATENQRRALIPHVSGPPRPPHPKGGSHGSATGNFRRRTPAGPPDTAPRPPGAPGRGARRRRGPAGLARPDAKAPRRALPLRGGE